MGIAIPSHVKKLRGYNPVGSLQELRAAFAYSEMAVYNHVNLVSIGGMGDLGQSIFSPRTAYWQLVPTSQKERRQ